MDDEVRARLALRKARINRRAAERRQAAGGRAFTSSVRQLSIRKRRGEGDVRVCLTVIQGARVDDAERPKTRADCAEAVRPCPWVSCKWHLYLDVDPENGSIKWNFPGLEPWELEDTCALDIADAGGATLEEVGEAMNLTRERVRQIEYKARLQAKGEL